MCCGWAVHSLRTEERTASFRVSTFFLKFMKPGNLTAVSVHGRLFLEWMACVLPFQFCQRSKSLPYQIGSFSTLRNETTGRIGEKPRKTYLSLVTIIVSPPASISTRYLPAELDFYSVYIIYLTKVRLLSFVHLWWSGMETGTGRFDFTSSDYQKVSTNWSCQLFTSCRCDKSEKGGIRLLANGST